MFHIYRVMMGAQREDLGVMALECQGKGGIEGLGPMQREGGGATIRHCAVAQRKRNCNGCNDVEREFFGLHRWTN